MGGAIVAVLIVAALCAPLIAPHDPTVQFRDALKPNGQPVGFSQPIPARR